jgi:hypothetical protein
VQSRVYTGIGSNEEAVLRLEAARSLAEEMGRGDTLITQLMTDTGPDVR